MAAKYFYCERCHGYEFANETGVCPRCHSNEETYMFDEWWKCEECGELFAEPITEEHGEHCHYVVNGDHDAYGWEEREVCPTCGSRRITKCYREDYENE